LRPLEYWIARSRLRQGFAEATNSRARWSFSEGGKPGDDGGEMISYFVASRRENAISRLPPPSCPAQAGIQYAVASRFKHCGLWNTGSLG
jgi:hypothetical protein